MTTIFRRNALPLLVAALLCGIRTAKACTNLCLFGCCDAPLNFAPLCAADNSCGVVDQTPVSLGVRFTTSQPICITGVLFYHQSVFPGDDIFPVYLWDVQDEINPLASGAVTGQGWLTLPLNPPIPMDVSDAFVASYTAPQGGYSYQYWYFSSTVVVDSVSFPGPNVNGRFAYATSYENFPFPGQGTSQDSNYFVTPLWVPADKIVYYIWDPTTNLVVTELSNNAAICIPRLYSIEARRCQEPATFPVQFKLSNSTHAVHRQKEYEAPYFLFGDTTTGSSTDVKPNPKPLPPGPYSLYTTVDGVTEIITFTQTC